MSLHEDKFEFIVNQASPKKITRELQFSIDLYTYQCIELRESELLRMVPGLNTYVR